MCCRLGQTEGKLGMLESRVAPLLTALNQVETPAGCEAQNPKPGRIARRFATHWARIRRIDSPNRSQSAA